MPHNNIRNLKMNKLSDLKIGDFVMRLRSSDKGPQWIKTVINATYLELIANDPDSYKLALTYSEAMEQSLHVRWKVSTCNSGEKCWCRVIEPEIPIMTENEDYISVISDGSINKAHAEHIVKLHNEHNHYKGKPLTHDEIDKLGISKKNGYPYTFLDGYLKMRNGVFFYKYYKLEVELPFVHDLENLHKTLTGKEIGPQQSQEPKSK